jgi:Fic-DOC domain mobile mystery protein B
MEFTYAPGATPIDPDEAAGLIPKHIVTQADLNAWEEANIVIADTWAFKQKKRDLLDEGFVRDLHSRMFDQTWRWAGKFRSSNKNIGVDWSQIAVRLHALLENTRYQIEHNTFLTDELAVWFHHQLVLVHAFPNGNGRHSRLLADVLITRLGGERFTWGSGSALTQGGAREKYLSALRTADRGEIKQLLEFARE